MKENRLRDERLQIMLSPEELDLVDDFRFKKRMPSRAVCRPRVNEARLIYGRLHFRRARQEVGRVWRYRWKRRKRTRTSVDRGVG